MSVAYEIPSPEAQMDTSGDFVTPESYHLDAEQLDELEGSLVAELKEQGLDSGVIAVAVGGRTDLSNFGRTLESNIFANEGYDFYEGMKPYEDQSIFLYTVDLDLGKVAHSKRVVMARPDAERQATGLTGIEIFDDRLTSEEPEEQCDLPTILAYHDIETPDDCINVTTNMGTQRGAEPTLEKPYSLMSYKAVFELTQVLGVGNVIAYLNRYAVKSLAKLDLQSELLAGREFHLPTTGSSKGYDEEYIAVVIPSSPHNQRAFTEVNPDKPMTKLVADREVPLYCKVNDDEPFVRFDSAA